MINDIDVNDFLWAQKYRPKTVNDVILPQSIKDLANEYVNQGRIPNLIFSGSSGVGKTTLATAMCRDVGCDYLTINASSENSIDTLRTTVSNFASTTSFSEAKKVIILDEADHLTSAFQAGFRNFMETFSNNCTFILTCNIPAKIIDAVHSRCVVIDFKISGEQQLEMDSKFFKRAMQIFKAESVAVDKMVVAEIIKKFSPDYRRCLNEFQRIKAHGVDPSVILNDADAVLEPLIEALKNKKFIAMCQWVEDNIGLGYGQIFKMFEKKVWDRIDPKFLPGLILMLDDAQTKAAVAIDPSITVRAFFTTFMNAQVTWK